MLRPQPHGPPPTKQLHVPALICICARAATTPARSASRRSTGGHGRLVCLQAGSKSIGGCVSKSNIGTAKGCTYASSYAEAAATAYAAVHVRATAEAIAEYCPYYCADASSWSISESKAVAEIMAEAHAYSEVDACAIGAQPSTGILVLPCRSNPCAPIPGPRACMCGFARLC